VDFLRPGAIPALIGALLAVAASAARADCGFPGGTFQAAAKGKDGKATSRLEAFVIGDKPRDKDALIRVDKPGTGGGWGSDAVITRGQVTHLAETATFSRLTGRPRIAFHDKAGKRLVDLPMFEGWACDGKALKRTSERYSGVGDQVRTLEVAETFEQGESGELLYRGTVTEVEPRRGKPQSSEMRFLPAPRQP
jgi:hypothetical protein